MVPIVTKTKGRYPDFTPKRDLNGPHIDFNVKKRPANYDPERDREFSHSYALHLADNPGF